MTTSETLYRAEELFQERLQKKTNWGRNELIKEFQACIRQALGECLDSKEPVDFSKEIKTEYDLHDSPFKPKGYGGVVLHGMPDNSQTLDMKDDKGLHEENPYDTHKTASDEDDKVF